MKKTIIVSAFPGTGKTYFWVNTDLEVADSDFSKFDKKDFPYNYIDHIKSLMGVKDIILVSSHKSVREALVDHHIDFTLIYPSMECKEEYLERYSLRNNELSFISMMKANWESFIRSCERQEYCKHIVLKPGQFLSDIIQGEIQESDDIKPELIVPTKDDKAKYRRELKTALKEILVQDFGITREWVRDQTTSYIREIIDNKTKSIIEGITSDKINIVSKQIIHDHLVNEGVLRITRAMRHEVVHIGAEIQQRMQKLFNIKE